MANVTKRTKKTRRAVVNKLSAPGKQLGIAFSTSIVEVLRRDLNESQGMLLDMWNLEEDDEEGREEVLLHVLRTLRTLETIVAGELIASKAVAS